jgi:hypothetical protein
LYYLKDSKFRLILEFAKWHDQFLSKWMVLLNFLRLSLWSYLLSYSLRLFYFWRCFESLDPRKFSTSFIFIHLVWFWLPLDLFFVDFDEVFDYITISIINGRLCHGIREHNLSVWFLEVFRQINYRLFNIIWKVYVWKLFSRFLVWINFKYRDIILVLIITTKRPSYQMFWIIFDFFNFWVIKLTNLRCSVWDCFLPLLLMTRLHKILLNNFF